jgi:hypothetical protein
MAQAAYIHGTDGTEQTRLATRADIDHAMGKLRALLERDDATALFYWNRAAGVK